MNAWLTTYQGFVQRFVAAPAWAVLLAKVTAILLAAWLVHLALRWANPRWRVLLWRVTAVGLIALPLAAALLPAVNIHVAQAPPVKEPTAPVVEAVNIPAPIPAPAADRNVAAAFQDGFGENDNVAGGPRSPQLPAQPSGPADEAGPAPLPPTEKLVTAPEKPSAITLSRVLLAVWLSGVGALVCRLCAGYYRIRQMAGSARQAPQEVCNECLRVARAIGCRAGVEVLQSAAVQSPLLCGFRRVRLLLPAAMCEEAYRADLPAIFAHELAHVRSRDVFWNFGLHLISIALWIHPLAWRMRRAHLAACEMVSDAVSASFVGDVTEYCRTLARVAVHANMSLPATGIAMARRSGLSRRLGALKRFVFSRPLRRRNAIGFGLAALLAVAMLGVLRFALAAPPPTQLSAEPAAAEIAKTMPVETVAKSSEKPAEPAKTAAAAPKSGVLSVLVLDPQGKPLADTRVHSGIWTDEEDFKSNHDYKTDAAGIARVELPRSYYIVRVWAGKKPLVTGFMSWEENDLAAKPLPQQCTIRLVPGVAIGGRIVDEQGRPIAGVKVGLYGVDATKTDADGRWRIDGIANDPKANLIIRVYHPDYLSYSYSGQFQEKAVLTGQINVRPDGKPSSNLVGAAMSFAVDASRQIEGDTHLTAGMLRNEKATITLKRGIIARGRVTDPAGKPIKDALVVRGDDSFQLAAAQSEPAAFPTDADGRFQLPAMTPGERVLTVIAPGWAPQVRRIDLRAGLPPQDFRLESGKPIQLRIVDAEGKPIPKAHVYIAGWRGYRSLYTSTYGGLPDSKIPAQTDNNGVWEWTWAPSDLVSLQINVKSGNGVVPFGVEIAGGGPPRTVTLKPDEHAITVRATDAVTGKPISIFNVIPVDVFRSDWLVAERNNAKVGKNGQLDYHESRNDISRRLRVEATGYRTQTGPEFRMDGNSPRTMDFRLQPSPPVTGVVLDAAGRPVAKAKVLLATPSEEVRFDEIRRTVFGHMLANNHATNTDDAGRFSFPDLDEPFTVVVWADAGFAQADFPAGRHDTGALRLQPWASVRGRVRDGGRAVPGISIIVSPVSRRSFDNPDRAAISADLGTSTDAEGRFEFKEVPPCPVGVGVDMGGMFVPLELRPGQQADLELGGGAVLKGKVALTGKIPPGLDVGYSAVSLIRRAPGIAPPPEIAGLGFDIRNGWHAVWGKTSEGRSYLSTLQNWFVRLAPDRTFRFDRVPPGDYDLAVEVYLGSGGGPVETLAENVVRVTVTEADAARGELTLPEISAAVAPDAGIGGTPQLTFHRADGSDGSLTEFAGHYTVLDFWASWSGSCKRQLPRLRKLREKYAAQGLAVLGLSLDDDPAAWQAAVKRLDLPWPQGRIAAGSAAVDSVPKYWLLDPAGKIVAKAFDLDKLAAALEKALPKPVEKAKPTEHADAAEPSGVQFQWTLRGEAKAADHADAASPKSAENLAIPVETATAAPKTNFLSVLVVDPQGKPLAGANVHAGISTEEKDFNHNRDYETDASGVARVELPKTFFALGLKAGKSPLVPMTADWSENELANGKGTPKEYTFRLESGVTAGGRIVDEQGKPIAGVKVQAVLGGDPKPAKGDGRATYNIFLAYGTDAVTTDADGRWHIDNVPNNAYATLSLQIFHPDFVSDEFRGQLQQDAGITMKMLQSGTATFTLKRGIIVRGQVTDPAGKPIKDALLVRGLFPEINITGNGVPDVVPTDADGRFRLSPMPPGEMVLTVIAPGWAPQLRRVNLQADAPPQDFHMTPGKPIQLRIVDAAGKPIPEAHVEIETWRGGRPLYNWQSPQTLDSKIPYTADKNGIWEWTWAPDDPVKMAAYSRGYAADSTLEIAGGAPPRTVTLTAARYITGSVTDDVTGKPIPAFTVFSIDRIGKDSLASERYNAKLGKDGRLNYRATRNDNVPVRLRVEATGYRNQTGPEFREDDSTAHTQDFRLQPSPPVTGVVLDAAGQPLARAKVLLATPTEAASLGERVISNFNNEVITDSGGRFSFPDPGEPFTVLARTDAGFALAEFPAGQHDTGALRLQPWASVSGQFRDGERPVGRAMIDLFPVRLNRARIGATLRTRTDADGRFEFPQVLPLPTNVRVELGPWTDVGYRSAPSMPLELHPGQQAKVDFGGPGTVVKGKVTLTGKVPADLDCAYSLNFLVRRAPGIPPPPAFAAMGFDIHNDWQAAWARSSEGNSYMGTLQNWFVKLAPDGGFRISGVPPGEYDLAIAIYAKPNDARMGIGDLRASKVVRVMVTAEDAARGELILPEIAATVVPSTEVGVAPALSFERADGTAGLLADLRGRWTVVHYWASWSESSMKELQMLKLLQQRYTAGKLALLGLSLDEDPAAWQAGLKRLDSPWPQGRIAASDRAKISHVPEYWLLDPAGKIVAKCLDLDEVAKALEKALPKPLEKGAKPTDR